MQKSLLFYFIKKINLGKLCLLKKNKICVSIFPSLCFLCIYQIPLFIILITTSAFADTITEISPINFGTIAIQDNSAAYTLRVRYTGQIINDPQIIIIIDGTPGEFLITALPASTALTINVTSPSGVTTSPSASPTNEQFSISNFDYLSSVNSDVNGEYTLFLGATITTSGSGVYEDTLYVTTMNITVSF